MLSHFSYLGSQPMWSAPAFSGRGLSVFLSVKQGCHAKTVELRTMY